MRWTTELKAIEAYFEIYHSVGAITFGGHQDDVSMEIPCVEPGDGETVTVAWKRSERKFNKIVLIEG